MGKRSYKSTKPTSLAKVARKTKKAARAAKRAALPPKVRTGARSASTSAPPATPRSRTLASLSRSSSPRPLEPEIEVRCIAGKQGPFPGKRREYRKACKLICESSIRKNNEYAQEHEHFAEDSEERNPKYFDGCTVKIYEKDCWGDLMLPIYKGGEMIGAASVIPHEMKVGRGATRYECSLAQIECFGIAPGVQGRGVADKCFQAVLTYLRPRYDVIILECIASAKTQWFYYKNKMALLCPQTNMMIMSRFFRNTPLVHQKQSLYRLFKGALEKSWEEKIEPQCGGEHVMLFVTR